MSDTRYCPKCGESCGREDRFCGSCREELRPLTSPPGGTPRSRDSLDGVATELGLLPNSILMNRYRIIREIGSGGMGLVYEAEDEKLKMRVAVKVMREILSRDPGSVSRLIAEAKHSMVLSDLNIVRVHNFEDDTTVKFLVMEYVEGGTLAGLLAKQEKLTEAETCRLAIEICKGLQHAHDRKIYHRDLKPANILIGKDGTVKIADFGIARACRDSMTRLTSQADSGTLLYMAPEQLDGETSAATDVYSLGVVLYEMLSGNPPFHTGFIPDQIRRILPKLIPGVSEAMNRIVLKCLEKNPADRFATAGELREELDGTAAERRARQEEDQRRQLEQAEGARLRAEEKEAARRAAQEKRTAAERLVGEGLRLSEEGKLTEAEAVLRQAFEADRSNPQVWDALKVCREKRKASEQKAPVADATVETQANTSDESKREIPNPPAPRTRRWRWAAMALLTVTTVLALIVFYPRYRERRELQEALERGWWQDPKTSLIWAAKEVEPQSWDDANESCQNLDVGGYQAFRLPTIEELAELRDPKMPNQIRGPITTTESTFWSSTPDEKVAATASIFGTYENPTPMQLQKNLAEETYLYFHFPEGSRGSSGIFSTWRHAALCVRTPGRQAPDSNASAWLDPQTGLVWTTQESGRDMSMPFWGAAKAYCDTLHRDEYANWRLPTIDELQGLFDTRQPNHMRGPFRVSFPYVWSGTFVDRNKAWTFGFREGQRHSLPADSPYTRALCVRPGIWTDPQTKLMWTASHNEEHDAWKQADSYCRDLKLGGYSGWRMPTIEELAALYDPDVKMRGSLRATSFPGFGVWSSTPKGQNEYWTFNFFKGERSSLPADFAFGALTIGSYCVRPSGGASDLQKAGGSPGASATRAETFAPAKPKNTWEEPADDPFGGDGGIIKPATPKGR
jgi:tRNA A-37 threonylcarbamoyl transferase component Bud32